MPKLAIRDFLWAMLVIGMALGWAVDHRRLAERVAEVQRQWLDSIPGPEPKPELRVEMLDQENDALRTELDALKQSGAASEEP